VTEPNYLIGYGERLTETVVIPKGFGPVDDAYSVDQAKARLEPMIGQLAASIVALPSSACPHDYAVAALTLHPQYVARSYFPDRLLRVLDAEVVGSRPATVEPEEWGRKTVPEGGKGISSVLYVAAPRVSIAGWSERISSADSEDLAQLVRIEEVHVPGRAEKLRLPARGQVVDAEEIYEVVLHATDDDDERFVIAGFEQWCAEQSVAIDITRRISAGGLTFVPVVATRKAIERLSDFSFLRVARPMPRLRTLRPDSVPGENDGARTELPDGGPLDSKTRAVIFDGGVPQGSELLRWCTPYVGSGIGDAHPDYMSHGHTVTSALLFGSLHDPPRRPFTAVDHFRVLDAESDSDPYELYDALRCISEVLDRLEPEFVNLSIGPDLPIEDDEVHAWTAVIDEYISRTAALVTIAVGNRGELDRTTGNARIQTPADAVNALAVGASLSPDGCRRAPYSCIGPGRSPGLVKPDILAFGGGTGWPFVVADPRSPGKVLNGSGTSFAAPAALRAALGVRAHLGDVLTPLTLKALLVHCASRNDGDDSYEVGWGAIPANIEDIITTSDGSARVVYQGTIDPAKYVRAILPLPHGPLDGLISISATFAFVCEVDPQDPSTYTRSGLEVYFRPHSQKYPGPESTEARTKSFFGSTNSRSEQALRSDAHKWETVLHQSKRFRATSLDNPVFDVHYLAREGGAAYGRAPKMRYSLVITVEAPGVADLYDRVLRAYPTQLEVLTPVIEIPIQAS